MNIILIMLIYSKVTPSLLLHVINRKADIEEKRNDLIPEDQFLQVGCFRLNKDKTFKAHKHITNNRDTTITQESWVVIQGKIKAFLYDTDDTLLEEVILEQGDCTITLYGGHNYLCLEDNTLVYEYKNGPYTGQANDKVFI